MTSLDQFCKTAQKKIGAFSKKPILFFCKEFDGIHLSIEDRKNFRKWIVQEIKSHRFYQKHLNSFKPSSLKAFSESLLEIGSRPEHPLFSISISHCKNLATFVLSAKQNETAKRDESFKRDESAKQGLSNKKEERSKQNGNSQIFSLGLDIEEKLRVSQKVISRVSSLEEQKASPSPSFLWTAKEASLKCFSQNQTNLILSECLILDWKASEFQKTYLFKAKSQNQKARGIAFCVDSIAVAYAEI